MLKKINIYSEKDVLYITDDEKEAEKLLKEKRKQYFLYVKIPKMLRLYRAAALLRIQRA